MQPLGVVAAILSTAAVVVAASNPTSSTTPTPTSTPAPWKMQTVRTIQARVQNSPPAWNATMGRWVGNFSGSDPYIGPMDSMTTATVEGALLYIQQKLGNDDVTCTRGKNMSSIWIYDITFVQPPPSVALYGPLSVQVPEYGHYVDMVSGSCDKSNGNPANMPGECNEVANKSDVYYGPYVGATVKLDSDYGDYNDTLWFSYPNSCVLQKYANKTAECRAAQPGGLCPLGVAPDGIKCTFNYTILGHISLDDLVGITNMTFKNDSTRYYKDRTEFCLDGRIEYQFKNGGTTVQTDVEFWKDGLNRTMNSVRSRMLIEYYDKYRNKSNMKALPSVESLRAENPPCYMNNQRCASSKYGCSRSLLAQVCQHCTSADPFCVAKPPDKTIVFPVLSSSAQPASTQPPATPTPTQLSSPPSSSSLGTGAIVGIVVGAVAVIGVIGLFVVRRNRRAPAYKGGGGDMSAYTNETTLGTMRSAVALEELVILRLNESKMQLEYVLGSGSFADVWFGTYDGQPVAVKKLHPNRVTLPYIESFAKEIKLMSDFDSPYIVRCVGATWTRPRDLACVMEYMDSADLRTLLEKTTPETLPWVDKLSLMAHMISGLCYLHSYSVIHRDFKSRNLLVDSQKGLKLTDFGISREVTEATMTVGVGTFRWMAPEVIQGQAYTVAADIYSFGMTLYELDSHQLPYHNVKHPTTGLIMTDTAIILAVGQGLLQPTFSDACPDWLRSLALRCIAHDPEERPTSNEVLGIVRAQVRLHQTNDN
ncbi:unnamed protein product [Aphanomyces euteiches]